GSHVHQSL
ncbi:hypothetical protein WJX84_006037, partial [Apatococcus fuscideae]